MSGEEYGIWMAAFEAEPWGEDRMDVGFGVVASTVANVNRKPDSKAFNALDFAPYLKTQKPTEPEEEMTPMKFIAGLRNG